MIIYVFDKKTKSAKITQHWAQKNNNDTQQYYEYF